MTRVLLGSISVSFENWLPYASGCIISYCKNKLPPGLFQFLEPLYSVDNLANLEQTLQKIDVLGLSHYVWNEHINSEITKIFKEINPNGIVIWGGPSIPKDLCKQESFASNNKTVDFFVTGMGEKVFADLLYDLFILKKDRSAFPKFLNAENKLLPLDNFSPYLDGTFESILNRERKIKASFETNRGCPYNCSFCDWGGQSQSRFEKLNEEVVDKVIDYLFSHSSISEIEILDSNFGIFRSDLDTVIKMIAAKDKYKNNPNISYSGLAKNGSKFLTTILEKMYSELNLNSRHLKLSFQSHSKETLDANGRQNIRGDKLELQLEEVRALIDIPISSELIIGLPGDNAERFLFTLNKDIELNMYSSRAYILSVTENTALTDKKFIEKYNIKTKSVHFPCSFSKLNRDILTDNPHRYTAKAGSENFTETHRIIHTCDSYDTNELLKIYKFWWFHNTFYNSGALTKTLKYLANIKSGYSFWLSEFVSLSAQHPILGRQICWIEEFVHSYFSDEEVSYIDNYSIYLFSSGAMRTTEIYQLLKHQNSIKSFLQLYFSDLAKKIMDPQIINLMQNELKTWKKEEEIVMASEYISQKARAIT
jgi:hypothetical protein